MSPKAGLESKGSVTDGRFAKALGLALALHAPVLLGTERGAEIWQERNDITYALKERAKSMLGSHPAEKEEFVKKLKEDLENGAHIDLGEFYLRSEYLDGRIDESEMKKSMEDLSEIENSFRPHIKTWGVIATLRMINNEQGEYAEAHSYLSSILIDKKGNCQAREKFTASLIHRLYPDMKMAYQRVKIDGLPHTRTLVQINGQWHNMEEPDRAMTATEIESTALNDQYDYVLSYVGLAPKGRFVSPADSTAPKYSHTRFNMTDDYLELPMPKGTDWDRVVNLNASQTPGLNIGLSQGQGAMGIVASANTNRGSAINNGGGGAGQDLAREPIEVEILTADSLEVSRRRTRAILDHWKTVRTWSDEEIQGAIKRISPTLPDGCAKKLIPIVRVGTEELPRMCYSNDFTGALSCNFDNSYMEERLNSAFKAANSEGNNFFDADCPAANVDALNLLESEEGFIQLGFVDL